MGSAPTARASDVVAAACLAADAAARAAAVEIRGLTSLAELGHVPPLFERIWQTSPGASPVTADMLKALVKAGSYVCGAYDRDELVGACVGFFAEPARHALHSHIAGVSAAAQGRSVGFALKLHQRAWSLLRGISEIYWTYDPLIRRNAYFNMVKLGAEVTEYLPNFYGPLDDVLNGSDDTDRALVNWRLTAPAVVAACDGRRRLVGATDVSQKAAVVGLDVGPTGWPVRGQVDAATVLVGVPSDIEALRGADPMCAAAWRAALRDVLGGLVDDGGRVRGFDPLGWYVVDRLAKA